MTRRGQPLNYAQRDFHPALARVALILSIGRSASDLHTVEYASWPDIGNVRWAGERFPEAAVFWAEGLTLSKRTEHPESR
jgi:hypothetical protein